MPGSARMPRAWSRRSLLVAVGLGSAGAVAGCGVRLEDDVRGLPLLPRRRPVPDEQALLDGRRDADALRVLAVAVGGPARSVPARLVSVHARQLEVLEQVLRGGGVPLPTLAPAATPSATATSTASPTPTGTPAAGATPSAPTASPVVRLRTAEASAAQSAALNVLAGVSSANVALLGATQAQRVAAVRLLGGVTRWAAPSGPSGADGARLLDATRAAAYGFEVVAAQADRETRPLALATLAALRTREELLWALAGTAAGARALGYELPFPVVTPTAARRLAGHVLAGLLASCGAGFAGLAGDQAGLAALVRWTAETEVLAARWGAPISPFPGLKTT